MSRATFEQLSAKAQGILEDLPPWYQSDGIATAIIAAMAGELQRIEDMASELRLQMYPQNADDSWGILGMWEALFGLPVAPAGVLIAARRGLVLAHLQKRSSGAGFDWEDQVTQALQSNQWSYQEGPTPYTVTVRFPYAPGGYTVGQALVFLRQITPAHLQLVVGYSQGFLIGISNIGDVL